MTSNQPGESVPKVDLSRVMTFSAVVVVAIAIFILAWRNSWIKRITPGRKEILPLSNKVTK